MQSPVDAVRCSGIMLLERLIHCGQLIPAWTVKDALCGMTVLEGAWALLRANQLGAEQSYQLLQEAGADIFTSDQEGNSLLHKAACSDPETVKYLLDNEGVLLRKRSGNGMGVPGQGGAENHDRENTTVVISGRICVNWQNGDGYTPLHLAAMCNQAESARLLLIAGAATEHRGLWGCTPLHVCTQEGHEACLVALLQHTPCLEVRDNNDRTPLQIAAARNHLHCLRLLVQAGSDLNAKTRVGKTALHLCAQFGCVDAASILVEAGVRLNEVDLLRQTPLFVAALYGSTKVVQLLADAGADLEAKDRENLTALHIAVMHCFADLAGVLVAAGADITAQNNGGQSALEVALSTNCSEIVCLLRR